MTDTAVTQLAFDVHARAIRAGDESCPGIPGEVVFAELRKMIADMRDR